MKERRRRRRREDVGGGRKDERKGGEDGRVEEVRERKCVLLSLVLHLLQGQVPELHVGSDQEVNLLTYNLNVKTP